MLLSPSPAPPFPIIAKSIVTRAVKSLPHIAVSKSLLDGHMTAVFAMPNFRGFW